MLDGITEPLLLVGHWFTAEMSWLECVGGNELVFRPIEEKKKACLQANKTAMRSYAVD